MALSLAGVYTEVPLKDVVLLTMGTKVNGQHSYYGSLKLNSLSPIDSNQHSDFHLESEALGFTHPPTMSTHNIIRVEIPGIAVVFFLFVRCCQIYYIWLFM